MKCAPGSHSSSSTSLALSPWPTTACWVRAWAKPRPWAEPRPQARFLLHHQGGNVTPWDACLPAAGIWCILTGGARFFFFLKKQECIFPVRKSVRPGCRNPWAGWSLLLSHACGSRDPERLAGGQLGPGRHRLWSSRRLWLPPEVPLSWSSLARLWGPFPSGPGPGSACLWGAGSLSRCLQ